MIATVTQIGLQYIVRDEHGRVLCSPSYNSSELVGYTAQTWSIRINNMILVFDERGHQLSTQYI